MRSCVILEGGNMKELASKAAEAKQKGSDLVEINFNSFNDYSNLERIENFPVPVIISCNFTKDQETIVAVKRALKFKTEFVDIDLAFPKNFIEETFSYARSNGIKTIISYYPDSLANPKHTKKIIEDMSIMSRYMKIGLPPKSKKDRKTYDEMFEISSKTGSKLVLVNTGEPEKRNFITYGKIGPSEKNKNLPEIEDVKRSIIENVKKTTV
ncbi:MAG: type I 3-dehydroquinate dehydratase [Candidatus Aenigmarchaeota archaeon]|nr:type I 3-dehydroquinate dehydratase [Candidatus Aenigmarchaeota archaeon]